MANPFFILLACSLAVFRLAECIAVDNGPMHVFKNLRDACKGHPILCEFVTCVYCLSGWLSIIAAAWLVSVQAIPVAHAAFWWAAIWGGAAGVFRVVRVRE